jgi:proteasome lid subunit RPN8/RPN11
VKDSPDFPGGESPNLSIGSATAAHNVELDEVARDAIDEHVSSDTHVEKGGILVGNVDDSTGRVTIVAAVPANRAVSAPASLTFTHEAWDEVNDILARDYPDHRMVGWYHSHPRFGIFLSEYDTFIQSNFFSMPWQLAYVVDPVLGNAGFFGWESDQLVRVQDWTVLAHGGAKSVRQPERGPAVKPAHTGELGSHEDQRPSWLQPHFIVGLALIVLLLGLLLGYLLGHSGAASTPGPTVTQSNSVVIIRGWSSAGGDISVDVWITNPGNRTVSGKVINCYPDISGQRPTSTTLSSGPNVRIVGDKGTCSVTRLPPATASRLQLTFTSQSEGDISNYRNEFKSLRSPTFSASTIAVARELR